jgi:hypothetical protein
MVTSSWTMMKAKLLASSTAWDGCCAARLDVVGISFPMGVLKNAGLNPNSVGGDALFGVSGRRPGRGSCPLAKEGLKRAESQSLHRVNGVWDIPVRPCRKGQWSPSR